MLIDMWCVVALYCDHPLLLMRVCKASYAAVSRTCRSLPLLRTSIRRGLLRSQFCWSEWIEAVVFEVVCNLKPGRQRNEAMETIVGASGCTTSRLALFPAKLIPTSWPKCCRDPVVVPYLNKVRRPELFHLFAGLGMAERRGDAALTAALTLLLSYDQKYVLDTAKRGLAEERDGIENGVSQKLWEAMLIFAAHSDNQNVLLFVIRHDRHRVGMLFPHWAARLLISSKAARCIHVLCVGHPALSDNVTRAFEGQLAPEAVMRLLTFADIHVCAKMVRTLARGFHNALKMSHILSQLALNPERRAFRCIASMFGADNDAILHALQRAVPMGLSVEWLNRMSQHLPDFVAVAIAFELAARDGAHVLDALPFLPDKLAVFLRDWSDYVVRLVDRDSVARWILDHVPVLDLKLAGRMLALDNVCKDTALLILNRCRV
jgi:hypothetical protein